MRREETTRVDCHRPDISVVIPAYNCEIYVEEAILSLVIQDVGFEEHMQIVLVNDGSTDGTAEVCGRYADLYPHNIVFINQENAGASAARLAGLARATGKYVNFLDADDMWSDDACSSALQFFDLHSDVNICAARHSFFGAKEGDHPLTYKFLVDGVVDLSHVIDFPQLSLSNAFVRRDLVKPEYFDNRLSVSEDFLVVNRILMNEMRFGVMSKPVYWYRKRDAGDSAIDTSSSSLSWYLDTPRYCYRCLFDESKERFGRVLPHIQYAVMYDLQWRLKNRLACPLDEGQLGEYRSMLLGLLDEIDDAIVMGQRNLEPEQALYILGLKHARSFGQMREDLRLVGEDICWAASGKRAVRVSGIKDQRAVRVDFIQREGDEIVLDGRLATYLPAERVRLLARCSKWERNARFFSRHDQAHNAFFDQGYYTDTGFELRIPWEGKKREVEFLAVLDEHAVPMKMLMGKFCPLSIRRFDYALFGDMAVMISGRDVDKLVLAPANAAKLAERETLFEGVVWSGRPDARDDLKWRRSARARQLAEFASGGALSEREDVWLVSDRPTMAGDNGEALFVHLCEHPVPGVKPYFVLKADSPDFERMQAYGPVVAFGSDEHKRLHMRASKVISSAADEFIFDRFGPLKFLVKGLERFDFVFLQHGVTQNDISGWLNRYNKNIALFCCAAVPERDSILGTPAYGYGPDQVKLTGFARHDKLIALDVATPTRKKVLVAPTWRESLAGTIDEETGTRAVNPGFASSEYYAFFQGLLNDERLKAACERLGYEVEFIIHPAFAKEAEKFSSPFAHIATEYDYAREFVESTIMVTDYSSVAFDFALLRKPVVYAHFDYDTFYEAHPWERGYFDCERDGFGPVCADLDSSVGAIVALMEDPVMAEPYRSRADAFFYEPENGSRCEAIVEAILDIDRRKGRFA